MLRLLLTAVLLTAGLGCTKEIREASAPPAVAPENTATA